MSNDNPLSAKTYNSMIAEQESNTILEKNSVHSVENALKRETTFAAIDSVKVSDFGYKAPGETHERSWPDDGAIRPGIFVRVYHNTSKMTF